MKNKKWILFIIVAVTVVALCVVAVFMFGGKEKTPQKDNNETSKITTSAGKETKPLEQKVNFSAQYIRTGLKNQDYSFPGVAVIHSKDDLTKYYEANKDNFNLERYSNPGASFTISYPDACLKYNSDFFKTYSLIFITLKEGTDAVSHTVETVTVDANGKMKINISAKSPETGDTVMEYWHILTEIPKDKTPKSAEDVSVFYNSVKISAHTHKPAETEQTVDEPFIGYCGNTITTIYFEGGKSHTFMSGNSVTVTDILLNLKYDKNKICKCLPEYTIDTEFGSGYGVNLSEGYARCKEGQADLTKEQIKTLKEIILWAKEEAGAENPFNFEFSITWGTYGVSSYDSKNGTLIKTTDATHPEDYKTTLKLSDKQYSAIWKLIQGLDIESYPDNYNPHGNGVSTPYMSLVLSVSSPEINKTVTVKETMISNTADNEKGQKFLDVCRGIEEILTATEEWKSLPEYEHLYD